jgi:hypothetical protein
LLFPYFWWASQGAVWLKTMYSLGTPSSHSSPAHDGAAKVNSKATKSSRHMQMIDCFDLLPNGAKDALLEQLCGFSSTGATFKPTPTRNLDKKYQTEAESANSESAKDVKARLYAKHMEAERKTRETITAPKFPHINFRQASKSPSSHVLTGTLAMLRWSFVSKIVALIQSLAKRRGIKSSNPWSPRYPLGISAVCLQALILPNTMLQQMQYLGKPSPKPSVGFARNTT